MKQPKDFAEEVEDLMDKYHEEADHSAVVIALVVSAVFWLIVAGFVVAYLTW